MVRPAPAPTCSTLAPCRCARSSGGPPEGGLGHAHLTRRAARLPGGSVMSGSGGPHPRRTPDDPPQPRGQRPERRRRAPHPRRGLRPRHHPGPGRLRGRHVRPVRRCPSASTAGRPHGRGRPRVRRGAHRPRVLRRIPTPAARRRRAPLPPDPAGPPLRRARRRTDRAQARGPEPHGRPQDQPHDRRGAARQADGQAQPDRGDRRRPARRGPGDGGRDGRPRLRDPHGRDRRGQAAPTWCACACSARRWSRWSARAAP